MPMCNECRALMQSCGRDDPNPKNQCLKERCSRCTKFDREETREEREAYLLKKKPRFYTMDVQNYTPEFLGEIVEWQAEWIEHLQERAK